MLSNKTIAWKTSSMAEKLRFKEKVAKRYKVRGQGIGNCFVERRVCMHYLIFSIKFSCKTSYCIKFMYRKKDVDLIVIW